MAAASGAGTSRPVNSISFARAGPDQVHQPAERAGRSTVAQCSRNRDPDRRFRRRDTEVTRRRNAAPAAGGKAFNLNDCRLDDAVETAKHIADLSSYSMASVGLRKLLELRDVRSGDERLAAGAAEDEDAHLRIGIDPLARVDQRVVHRPRHRIARLRAIERQDGTGGIELENRLRSGHEFLQGLATPRRLRLRNTQGRRIPIMLRVLHALRG